MDFGIIYSNLQNGSKYLNSEDVYKDVQLIWRHWCKYNYKGDYVLELLTSVKKKFMKNFWQGWLVDFFVKNYNLQCCVCVIVDT